MFDWIAGFVASWVGRVAAPVIDLVHQVVHAAVGWLLGIIHLVQDSFSFWIGIIRWLIDQIAHVFRDIENWVNYFLHSVIPWIVGRVEAAFRYALDLWHDAISYAQRGLAILENLAWSWIQSAYRWVYDHVWLPLKRYADAIWDAVLKWGYTAFWWITHPDQLAKKLLGWLIIAAEDSFWLIAAPVGTFALRIVVANARRFALLLETIVTAVL